MISTRAEQFIAATGWGDATRTTIAGDASNRRYDRLRKGNKTAIVMDAPPDKGEDVKPFIRITEYLRAAGLSAPQVLAKDTAQGFLLLEDLGDDLFARVLGNTPGKENTLYQGAIDVLVHVHRTPAPQLAPYDAQAMTQMALLAFDWYQPYSGTQPAGRDEAAAALHAALTPLTPSVLIQRDYHAENLLWLPDRIGIARVGLLDYQDAMLGHPAYDLCSVLLDARRDVSQAVHDQMLSSYTEQAEVTDISLFKAAYWTLALQRNLRILGVFTRLCVRDGKAPYVDLIPRVWGHIDRALNQLGGPSIIRAALPEPTQDILDRIKAQCPAPR